MTRRWFLLIISALIAALLVWWALRVTLLDDTARNSASGYGQFILAIVGLLIIIGGWVWKVFTPTPEPTLDELTDLLALATRNQAEKTAIERRLIQPAPLPIHWELATDPITGPVAAATAQSWFDPLPGLSHAHLQSGDRNTLHTVYGTLPSGKLIITGGPGAGKSSAAVLLQLDALRFREQAATAEDRRRIPVPVMFTLHGWDPDTTSVEDWLVTKLIQIPLLNGRRARSLLEGKRIAFFLDGFDEIPETLGPRVLRALSDQTTFRVVLLGRHAELLEAAQKQILIGSIALHLKPLTPTATVDYLMRPLTEPAPAPWRRIATTINAERTSPLARALNRPLWVTLLHDIYPPCGPLDRPVDELLDTTRFPTPEMITEHLLDHAVIAAYTPRPGKPSPRYPPAAARRTLDVVSHHLGGVRDIAWWEIRNWVPRWAASLLAAVVVAFVFGVTGGVVLGFRSGLAVAVGTVLLIGVTGGAASLLPWPEGPSQTRRILREVRRPGAIAASLTIALAVGLTVGFFFRLPAGLVAGLSAGLVAGMAYAAGVASGEETNSADPIEQWRGECLIRLSGTVVLVVAGGFVFVVGLQKELVFATIPALGGGLVLAVSFVEPGYIAICQIYLAMRYRTPLRLLRFLEDARARHLLRTVGPVYQFRHATLQDRLCATSGVGGTPEVAQGEPGRSAVGPS